MVLFCLLVSINEIKSSENQKLSFAIETISTRNYNNYLYENTIDYEGQYFCYIKKAILSSNLHIVDKHNNTQIIKGVYAPFQLCKDKVFFLKNYSLLVKEIATEKTYTITKNVSNFIVCKDNIILLTKDYKLYCYNIISKKKHLLYTNINQFIIIDDNIFAIDYEDYLIKISLVDFLNKKIVQLPIEAHPFKIMSHGNNLIFTATNYKLGRLNTDNYSIDYFNIMDDKYINNRIQYICDENNLYYCLQHTKTNGSLVLNVDGRDNGVWQINLGTFEKTRISYEVFDELYLFENNKLFGRKDNIICELTERQGQRQRDGSPVS